MTQGSRSRIGIAASCRRRGTNVASGHKPSTPRGIRVPCGTRSSGGGLTFGRKNRSQWRDRGRILTGFQSHDAPLDNTSLRGGVNRARRRSPRRPSLASKTATRNAAMRRLTVAWSSLSLLAAATNSPPPDDGENADVVPIHELRPFSHGRCAISRIAVRKIVAHKARQSRDIRERPMIQLRALHRRQACRRQIRPHGRVFQPMDGTVRAPVALASRPSSAPPSKTPRPPSPAGPRSIPSAAPAC